MSVDGDTIVEEIHAEQILIENDELAEGGIIEEETFDDPGTPLENEFNADEDEKDSEDEDDFKIIIDDTRTNVSFRAPPGGQRGLGGSKTTQKLDIDATANINGAALYDLDLASLEDKPWRKPGADVTDYFNYGFTEESWQIYCERQRKLRTEYGPMNATRQYFLQNMSGVMPMNSMSQIIMNERPIPKIGGNTNQQVVVSNAPSAISSLAAATPSHAVQQPSQLEPQLIMRTRLTVPQPVSSQSTLVLTPAVNTPQHVPTLTSSVPLPQLTQPPQSTIQQIQTLQSTSFHSQSPPDSPGSTPPPGSGSMQPPGDSGPPGVSTNSGGGTQSGDNVHFLNLSVPPPRFPPTNLPPPNFSAGPPSLPGIPGMPPTHMPPPIFGHPPPPGVGMRFPPPFGFPPPNRPRMPQIRPGFRQGFAGFEPVPRDELRSPASYSDKSSDEEDRERYERHRRPRGSDHHRRSRSPSSSRPRSGRDYSGRERSTTHRSRHRSRSPVDRDRSYHSREERDYHDERKDSRSGDKRRKSEEDDAHKKMKKRKIKEEPLEEEDELQRGREKSSSKKPRDKSGDDKDRSKKRKKSRERHEDEQHQDASDMNKSQ